MASSILPKRELVSILTTKVPEAEVRAIFSIQPRTNLASRLQDLPKPSLVEAINSFSTAKTEMQLREQNFPLRSAPNAYLLVMNSDLDWDIVKDRVSDLASRGRTVGVLQPGQHVQAVYVSTTSRVVLGPPPLLEIPLAYEIDMEYVEPDPESNQYGELKHVYSLERALLWVPAKPASHALLICSDFAAVGPIRRFLGAKLGINCDLPNLTQEMLLLISQGGKPRTATFGTLHGASTGSLDASTVMLADANLAEKNAFKTLISERTRTQTSGFFSNHPGVLIGGLGISRRYGKMWTPAHLGLDALQKLAGNVITSVETQLSQTLDQSTRDYVSYYRNVEHRVGNSVIQGRAKSAFEVLLASILAAQRLPAQETKLSGSELRDLIQYSTKLRLQGAYEYECQSCHITSLARCQQCNQPLSASYEQGALAGRCTCGVTTPTIFDCDCGSTTPIINLENHLFLVPQPDLIQSVESAMIKIRQSFKGMFIIQGEVFSLLPVSVLKGLSKIDLQDLDLWKRLGKLHLRSVSKPTKTLKEILNSTKEKCYIDGVGPNQQRCDACIASKPTLATLESGQLCLLRMFGLPIGKAFDGIHTGAEMADIKYDDELPGLGKVRVGIHVKSYNKAFKHLGRGSLEVKGLYAQLAYSIFKVKKGEYPFDVLGVSVPQDLHQDALDSLRFLSERTAIPLIVMQRQDWLRVAEAAHEELSF